MSCEVNATDVMQLDDAHHQYAEHQRSPNSHTIIPKATCIDFEPIPEHHTMHVLSKRSEICSAWSTCPHASVIMPTCIRHWSSCPHASGTGQLQQKQSHNPTVRKTLFAQALIRQGLMNSGVLSHCTEQFSCRSGVCSYDHALMITVYSGRISKFDSHVDQAYTL